MSELPLSRRSFVVGSAAAFAGTAATDLRPALGSPESPVHQATGTRVGEMTANSAIVWTRLTAVTARNAYGLTFGNQRGSNATPPALAEGPVDEFEGACPGMAGRVRLRYGSNANARDTTTDWVAVTEADDFIHQFSLTGLQSKTRYFYAVETSAPGNSPVHGSFLGTFQTAPAVEDSAAVQFCVMTCQGYPDRGHPDGHAIYPAMQNLGPDFAVLTGDLVYYDNDPPKAVSPRLARYHWERMFSLPRLREFTRKFGTYWLKDDHDTLNNDSWAGQQMGSFTFAEGQKIFRQQAPMGDGPSYRTFRWGRNLQIWLTDGRDFRSPNKMPDGPDKTIWGAEQKAWFQRTVAESDATWKVLISPTPLVGPDRKNKNDNHANEGFQHEGDELRQWLQAHVPDNFFVICGDRHWQYHSVHPQTGVNEFSVGAASNEHAGGSPGKDPDVHRFHRMKGGFLSVKAESRQITFQLRDIDGNTVYQHKAAAG